MRRGIAALATLMNPPRTSSNYFLLEPQYRPAGLALGARQYDDTASYPALVIRTPRATYAAAKVFHVFVLYIDVT